MGVEKTYTDYHQLLADPDVDAVEVITPHHLHCEIGLAALEAGKHVSMQKPIAVTATECDRLIEAANRSDKLFRVFEDFRYYPPMVKAKELLEAGEIGEPLSIRVKCVQGVGGGDYEIPYRRWAWRFDPAQSGGGRVIFDYGYHVFSIIIWFMGEIEKVYSWITNREIHHGWVLDSPAVAIWKYKGAEKYGSYEAVTSDDMLVQTQYGRPEDEWVELTGSRGFIWVTRCTANLLDRPPVIMYRDGVTTEFSNMDAAMGASFEIGVNDFFDGILSGRQPQLTAEEGKAVFQFCRAIQLSAKEGREVRPEEIN
jgi:predicted dehydrogenase